MPKAIVAGFDELQSRLNITTLQSGMVASRHTNVRDAIKAEFRTLEDFLTGLYRRNTMILPLRDADVDVMIMLDPSYHGKYGATALLDRVRPVLLKSYTTPKVSRSGQAVTITFSDFQVDAVVGYNRKGGGYIIGNSSADDHLSTNPKKHFEQSSASNSAQNGTGMCVPLVRSVMRIAVRLTSRPDVAEVRRGTLPFEADRSYLSSRQKNAHRFRHALKRSADTLAFQ